MSNANHAINKKTLMVFVEPTPYVIDLINAIQLIWHTDIMVIFLKKKYTQNWSLNLKCNHIFLEENFCSNFLKIYKLLRKKQFGFIHLAGWANPYSIFLFLLTKIKNIPLAVESDTFFLSSRWWKRCIKRIVYPLLFKIPVVFFPGGTRQAKYLIHYKVPQKKIVIAQMTVNVRKMQNYLFSQPSNAKELLRGRYNIAQTKIVFLYVGRLEDFKGVQELVECFIKIKLLDAILCVVGDGSLKSYIKTICANNNNVKYFGHKEGNELFDIYLLSDVTILFSPLDQWGLVVNESMAFAKPVIVSDQVGCADDLVIPNKTGLIVPWNNCNALIEALRFLCKNTNAYQNMSKNAAELISGWTLENEAGIICNAWLKYGYNNII